MSRFVRLNFSVNVNRYYVYIYERGCLKFTKLLSGRNCLNVNCSSNKILVVIKPFGRDYNESVYYNLKLSNKRCFDLAFNFIQKITPSFAKQTFFLTDINYGLKIDGVLNFFSLT